MANKPSPSTQDVDVDHDPAAPPVVSRGLTAPASEPEAADTQPASGAPPAPPRAVISSVRESGIDFIDDPKKLFPGYSADKIKDFSRIVACHAIDGFSGSVRVKDGTMFPFKFLKHEVIRLPKWFALLHPTRLIIKE